MQAVGVQLVLMFVQPGDAAQVDHVPMLLPGDAHRMSASNLFTRCGASPNKRRLISLHSDPAPRREAGLICLRNGQTAEGLRWLQGAVEVAPGDRASHAALADFYRGQGDAQRADYHRQRAR